MPPIANCGEMTAPDVTFGGVAWFPQGFAGCARDVDTSATVSNIAASVVSLTEFIATSLTWSFFCQAKNAATHVLFRMCRSLCVLV
ncbi:MAG: hypothetical protein WBW06_18430 [Xanthobacteraceae bacterium]